MSVNSINIAYGASYGAYTQKLTQETKAKLEELGIAYNQNITEKEAKKLIQTHEAKKHEQENNSFSQNQNKKDDLMEKALKLAKEVGVSVDENATFTQIIAIIENALESKISASKGNMIALNELKVLSEELASLQAQGSGSMGYDNINQALMMSLEMLGEYNKNFIKR